jgi:opacity protein-like surface antigen
MRKYSLLFLFLFTSVAPALLWAQGQGGTTVDYGIGTTDFEQVAMSGWQFLKLPTTARNGALGGVISSLGHGDASSALTNPASIMDVKNIDVAFTQMNWLVDIAYYSGAVVKNFGKWGNIGVNFIYVDYGDMPRTENRRLINETGQYTGQVQQILDDGTYSANDYAIGLSYARQITDRFQVGGSIKYVSETLDDASAGAVSIDIGTVFYTGLKTFRIAMTGRNFGADTQFLSYNTRIGVPAVQVKMPMVFTLGGAVDLLEGGEDNPHLLTVAAEFVHPNDGPEKVNVGAEYTFMSFASLRGGYRFNYDEEGLTLGAGLKVKPRGNLTVAINYAYIDFGRLNSVNMFTLNFGL